jgi:ATP-binding cassette subfamily F protein uup
LLEELLQDYEGTVFLVSHDRAFMDNVVTSIIACEASDETPGFWREYEGSVQDWLTQSQRSQTIQAQNKAAAAKLAGTPQGTSSALAKASATTEAAPQIEKSTASVQATPMAHAAPKSAAKLSYKEQRELDSLPGLIESLENEQKQIRLTLEDSSLFAKDPAKATALYARDAEIDSELMAALERWETLSAK